MSASSFRAPAPHDRVTLAILRVVLDLFGGFDTQAHQAHIRGMNDPTQRTLEDMAADLDLSEAQAARGETVPVAWVLARLDASIARLASKQRQPREAERAR